MPNRLLGELTIEVAVVLRAPDRSATIVGRDLLHALRLRDKYAPALAAYGEQIFGHALHLTSRWNAHDGAIGFLVTVDTEAAVESFSQEDFNRWLKFSEEKVGGLAVEVDHVANDKWAESRDPVASGGDCPTGSLSLDSADAGQGESETLNRETSSKPPTPDGVREASPLSQRDLPNESVVKISEGGEPSPAQALTESHLEPYLTMVKALETANTREHLDVVSTVTRAACVITRSGRHLVEQCEMLDEVTLGMSLGPFTFCPTGETAHTIDTLIRNELIG